MATSPRAKLEALKMAERLGHHLTSFAPYGDKENAYCQNPSCKIRLIIQGDKAEGHALPHVCPVVEGDGRNGVRRNVSGFNIDCRRDECSPNSIT